VARRVLLPNSLLIVDLLEVALDILDMRIFSFCSDRSEAVGNALVDEFRNDAVVIFRFKSWAASSFTKTEGAKGEEGGWSLSLGRARLGGGGLLGVGGSASVGGSEQPSVERVLTELILDT
jgi:hypothetical protein